jgi:hypothetical protein
MPKRPRFESTLLQIWEIPGLLKLTYSFLMKKQDYFETRHNVSEYLQLREICKTTKRQSIRLASQISPMITSLKTYILWKQLLPNLQFAKISDRLFQSSYHTPFSHLQGLCISGELKFHVKEYCVLRSCSIRVWNNSLLRHLEIRHCIVTEETVQEISIQFSNLLFLEMLIQSQPTFKIVKFPNLQVLELATSYENEQMQLEISDMVNLEKLHLNHGIIGLLLLSNISNLKHLLSRFCHLTSVIFQDDVPLLNTINLGFCILDSESMVSMQKHVNWESMIDLRVGRGWENIFPRLSCLETLTLEEMKEEPNILWRNLKHLKTLSCIQPCFNLLTIISCVQSLENITIFGGIVDCNQLLSFRNLQKVSLFACKFVNFDAILQLPKSTTFCCREDSLTIDQFAIWNQRCEFIK